jgi:hypothetical protein
MEMSLIYSQIELGSYTPMFDLPFQSHGHLVSSSFCVQLWSELEPRGNVLRPRLALYWTPTHLFQSNQAITDVALKYYVMKTSAMINRKHSLP